VTDLKQIDFVDPFGNTSNTFATLYPKEEFSIEKHPDIVYMPSSNVMLTLLRACVDCQTPQQLWFKI
jgi:hypothetical protein